MFTIEFEEAVVIGCPSTSPSTPGRTATRSKCEQILGTKQPLPCVNRHQSTHTFSIENRNSGLSMDGTTNGGT